MCEKEENTRKQIFQRKQKNGSLHFNSCSFDYISVCKVGMKVSCSDFPIDADEHRISRRP